MGVHEKHSRPPYARMLRVHEHLQSGQKTNCRKLAETLEVSPRTIQRDIDFMRDQLGLPIEYDPTAYAFYYTRKTVQFPTMHISEGELVALSVARQALGQYSGTPFERPLRAAFEKLTANLSDQIQFTWHSDLDASISFRTGGQGIGDLAVFEAASQAVLRREELEFSYRKLSCDRDEPRRVQPLHLACIDNGWFLFGLDLDRGGSVRTFTLTRIRHLRNTGRGFVRPKDFSVDEHLANSFGVFTSRAPEWIRLRFDEFGGRLVSERSWHASQTICPLPNGGLELEMHVGASPEVVRWVLGWGEHVEVVAPEHLRATILRAAEGIVARHGTRPSAAAKAQT